MSSHPPSPSSSSSPRRNFARKASPRPRLRRIRVRRVRRIRRRSTPRTSSRSPGTLLHHRRSRNSTSHYFAFDPPPSTAYDPIPKSRRAAYSPRYSSPACASFGRRRIPRARFDSPPVHTPHQNTAFPRPHRNSRNHRTRERRHPSRPRPRAAPRAARRSSRRTATPRRRRRAPRARSTPNPPPRDHASRSREDATASATRDRTGSYRRSTTRRASSSSRSVNA